MTEQKTNKVRIVLALAVLLCIVLVLIYGGSAPYPSYSGTDGAQSAFDSNWTFTANGETKTQRLPITVHPGDGSGILFENSIPAEREADAALCVNFYNAPFIVYFNKEQIYSYGLDAAAAGYKSVGNGFHVIPLPVGGGTVRIEIPPALDSPNTIFSSAYLMPGVAFLDMFVQNNILTIIAAMILFSIFIYILVARHAHSTEGSVFSLSFLCICAALWIVTRSGLLQFFTRNLILIDALDFLLFLLLPIAVLQFVQHRLRLKDRKLVFCSALSVGFLIVSSVLHVLRIVDFTQSLFVFHMILVLDFICILLSVFRTKGRQDLRLNVLRTGVVFLVSGAFIELLSYYLISFDFLQLSLLEISMLVFTVCMLYVWSGETRHIVEQLSRQAVFHKMAYTDELTGLLNRAAFERDTEDLHYRENKPLYLFMIDLNELKKINDTQGHEAGDIFIRNSTEALRQAVGEKGSLFRFGGDEFIILLPGGDLEAAALYRDLQPYMCPNDGSLRPSLSVGYAAFDPSDISIRSVLRRADKRMYRFKSKMHEANH